MAINWAGEEPTKRDALLALPALLGAGPRKKPDASAGGQPVAATPAHNDGIFDIQIRNYSEADEKKDLQQSAANIWMAK